MTQLSTYVPGHFSSTERVYRQLPALFNDNWLNNVFGEVDKAFDVPNAVYPYNVLQIRNDKQEITQYEVEVALAGVGKEHIDVKVRDGKLHINVLKEKEELLDTIAYLKKGISQRKGSMTFNLDDKVNSKKISSTYKDGLLKVIIPVVKPETIDVDIKVA
jgi:HSP20 family molecular chaperone IbpA